MDAMLRSCALAVAIALVVGGCPVHAPTGVEGAGGAGGVAASGAGGDGGDGAGGATSGSGGSGSGQGSGGGDGGGPIACVKGPWATAFSGASAAKVAKLVALPDGGAMVAGDFTGSLDLGGTTLVAAGRDAFVARLDPCGEVVWHEHLSGAKDEVAHDLAVGSFGGITLALSSTGEVELCGKKQASAGGALVRWNADGKCVVVVPVGSVGGGKLRVAAGPQSTLLVAGGVVGPLAFAPLLEPKGAEDAFVASLDPAGKMVWARRYGTSSPEMVTAIAPIGDGVWVAGTYLAALSFGGATTPLPVFQGIPLPFLVKLSPTGATLLAVKAGATGFAEPNALAPDEQGRVWMTLEASDLVAMKLHGLGHVMVTDSAGKVVAEATPGKGDAYDQVSRGLLLDGAGALVGGGFAGPLTLAGTTAQAVGTDGWLLRLDAKAQVTSFAPLAGEKGDQIVASLARTPEGAVLAAGTFTSSIGLPGTTLVGAGTSVYVARLAMTP